MKKWERRSLPNGPLPTPLFTSAQNRICDKGKSPFFTAGTSRGCFRFCRLLGRLEKWKKGKKEKKKKPKFWKNQKEKLKEWRKRKNTKRTFLKEPKKMTARTTVSVRNLRGCPWVSATDEKFSTDSKCCCCKSRRTHQRCPWFSAKYDIRNVTAGCSGVPNLRVWRSFLGRISGSRAVLDILEVNGTVFGQTRCLHENTGRQRQTTQYLIHWNEKTIILTQFLFHRIKYFGRQLPLIEYGIFDIFNSLKLPIFQ